MSDFFNEYKRTEKCEYSISKQENLIYEQIVNGVHNLKFVCNEQGRETVFIKNSRRKPNLCLLLVN
jgi:CRISPR/Cas system endoribonuclease Cas6 (RAMP superfamily)